MADDRLWRSFANCTIAGSEIDAMISALEEILAGVEMGAVRADPDTYEEEDWEADQYWACPYSIFRYKLLSAKGSAARGWFEAAVSFWRPEDERGVGWVGARRAKLYVGYSAPRTSGWTTANLVVDGVGQSPEADQASQWRWTKRGSAAARPEWFFCVELLTLQNREQLVREVARPLRLLIEGQSDEIAFANCRAVLSTKTM